MRMSTVCRPSIHGCLTGITGLQAAGAIQLQANQTTMLVNSMLEVQVTSLPQADRMMALTILLRALQVDNSASKLVIGATPCQKQAHRTQFQSACQQRLAKLDLLAMLTRQCFLD